MTSLILEPGGIVETIFVNDMESLDVDHHDEFLDHVTDFCIDIKGRVRLGHGIVSSGEQYDDDMEWIPSQRYSINECAWSSHTIYVEIELPNPATEQKHYRKIRNAFKRELACRINSFVPTSKEIED